MPEDSNGPQRFSPDVKSGLTDGQVAQRAQSGLTNAYNNNKTKSYKQIFKDNLVTFFNILNACLAALVIATGSYKDLAFMVVIVLNLGIGLFQEINAKRTLDKLSLLVASKVTVVRGGGERQVSARDLVLDDIMLLKTGDQLAVDGIVKEGYLEANESLISGESEIITKRPGDYLYSGSFIVSGSAAAQVDKVGEDSFANRISTGVKISQRRPSEIKTSINKILRIVSFIVIPIGGLMFLRQAGLHLSWAANITKTVAAMIGMIPEGLFLLASMSLAASAVILAYRQTLVQDLYCIETLAYVDVLCLDKTGTITEGHMQVEQVIPIDEKADAHRILANFCAATKDENATIAAIRDYAGPAEGFSPAVGDIPFSSARKYSAVTFEKEGTYILGAFEFVFAGREEEFPGLRKMTDAYANQGSRVLVLAHSEKAPVETEVPEGAAPVAFVLIADRIRKEAPDALRYFYAQDVDIKIISGDNPKTAGYVAKRAGVKNADHYIDATTLETDAQIAEAVRQYSVFGRVGPEQKKKMILALKKEGHTVAMTGDGVNDVLALKEADCSVAMASGSDAAKNISTLVLLDSDFSHMPGIVAEGRKVINNIQRVATLFITKTIYAILLAVSSLLLLSDGYPFSPLQLTLISFVTIGFPAFFLALEPNDTRVKGSFLVNVFAKSLPGGICVMLSILVVNYLAGFFGYTSAEISTMCIVLATVAGMIVVFKVSMPFTLMRKIIFIATIAVFVTCFTVFDWLFDIAPLDGGQWLALAVISACMPFIMKFVEWAVKKLAARYEKKHGKKMPDLPFGDDFVNEGKAYIRDTWKKITNGNGNGKE